MFIVFHFEIVITFWITSGKRKVWIVHTFRVFFFLYKFVIFVEKWRRKHSGSYYFCHLHLIEMIMQWFCSNFCPPAANEQNNYQKISHEQHFNGKLSYGWSTQPYRTQNSHYSDTTENGKNVDEWEGGKKKRQVIRVFRSFCHRSANHWWPIFEIATHKHGSINIFEWLAFRFYEIIIKEIIPIMHTYGTHFEHWNAYAQRINWNMQFAKVFLFSVFILISCISIGLSTFKCCSCINWYVWDEIFTFTMSVALLGKHSPNASVMKSFIFNQSSWNHYRVNV